SPPPNGLSSTVRCRSSVKSLKSWTRISMSLFSRPRLITPTSNGPLKNSGKIVMMSNSMLLVQIPQTLRQIHFYSVVVQVDFFQIGLGERNQRLLASQIHF